MPVYVDQFPDEGWGRWSGGGHMITSDIDELHAMARKIGLKRSWFQDSTFPHYDLTRNKRRLAIENGAIEHEPGYIPDDVLMKCRDGSYETHKDREEKARRRRREQGLQDVQSTQT